MEAATAQAPKAKAEKSETMDDGVTIKLKPLKDQIKKLCNLKGDVDEAKEAFAEQIQAVATQSRILPSVIKRLVTARTSKHFKNHADQVEQLSIVFTDVGQDG